METYIDSHKLFRNALSVVAAESGSEAYFALEAPQCSSFSDSIRAIEEQYRYLQNEAGLGEDTEVFVRCYVSDISTQFKALQNTFINQRQQTFVSVVEQPPASGSEIAIQAYHIKSLKPIEKMWVTKNAFIVNHGSYRSLWIKNHPRTQSNVYQQTKDIFVELIENLQQFEMTIQNDLIRTWVYVNDIDTNYKSMVDARRELFDMLGMTKDTHYVSSTGIEGSTYKQNNQVFMDSISIHGLTKKQIEYMRAFEHMSPTSLYNVTFERGTSISYGDRTHYYISGTASINKSGKLLYPGDITKQASRTLDNMNALLSGYHSGLHDLKQLIIYIRNPKDIFYVQDILKERVSQQLSYIIVQGSVCRSEWLVEIEGIAISAKSNTDFGDFI